jgi:CheY-like chemotaxis protein
VNLLRDVPDTSHSILVVDDEEEICRLLRIALERDGHLVLAAANGAEAVKILEETTVDIVITDVLMPTMDGYELITHLRRKHPNTRIIAMSGGAIASANHYLSCARAFGAVTTLPKPFNNSQIVCAIKAALNPRQ